MLTTTIKPVKLFIFAAIVLATAAALLPAGTAAAAPATDIGYVDVDLLITYHPDYEAMQQTMKAATDAAANEFTAKAAGLGDEDKMKLYNQLQRQVNAQGNAMTEAIRAKVVAAVAEVAQKKGLTAVVDKSVAIYGGVDITADVGRLITGK